MNERLLAQLGRLSTIEPKSQGVAEKIAERAREIAPVRTGYLRDHIHEQDGNVVSEADYSADVEFGTYKMAARPFMRPAVDEYEQEILAAAAKAVGDSILEAVK